jgi:uncharacterized protein (TIGR02598 family)
MNTPRIRSFALKRKRAAFTLVEVCIAMGIAAISLTSIMGLLPIGSSSNRNAIEQTRAISVAKAIVSDLRSTSSTSGSTPIYGLTPALASGSTVLYFNDDCFSHSSSLTSSSRYRVSVIFPSTSDGVINARVVLTWPAAADPAQASGSYEVFTMLGGN